MKRAYFDVYGYRFELRSTCGSAFDGLCQDFAFFRSDAQGGERLIDLCYADPEYDNLPDWDASIRTPRNIGFASRLSGQKSDVAALSVPDRYAHFLRRISSD